MFYAQTDKRWADYIYSAKPPHNETLYSSGCGIMSACNVINNLTDNVITPQKMADFSVKNGFRIDGQGTSWALFERISKEYGLEFYRSSNLDRAIECVNNGGMVVCSTVGGVTGLFSTGGHLFTFVSSNGDLLKFFDSYLYGGKYNVSFRKNKAYVQDGFVFTNKKFVYGEIQQYFCYNKKNIEQEDMQMQEKIYHYTVEVPDWGRGTIQKLLDKGHYKGLSESDLNLSESMLRVFVVHDRAGLYDL